MLVLCLGLENILIEDPEHTVPASVLELPTYFGYSINRCSDVRNPKLKKARAG